MISNTNSSKDLLFKGNVKVVEVHTGLTVGNPELVSQSEVITEYLATKD